MARSIPLRQRHRLPRQRVRAIAQKLNTAIGDERMADCRRAFKRRWRRLWHARLYPRVIIGPALRGEVGAPHQDRRRERRLDRIAVVTPARVRAGANKNAVRASAARAIEQHLAVLCVMLDYRLRAHRPHHNAPPASTTHCRPPTLAQLLSKSVTAINSSVEVIDFCAAAAQLGGVADAGFFDGVVFAVDRVNRRLARLTIFTGHRR